MPDASTMTETDISSDGNLRDDEVPVISPRFPNSETMETDISSYGSLSDDEVLAALSVLPCRRALLHRLEDRLEEAPFRQRHLKP